MSSDSTTDMQRTNGGSALFEVLVATIPAVLIYFVGWAYLHFYLKVFGIGMSELDLDVQTILIYSYPVIQKLGWAWIMPTIGATVVFVLMWRQITSQATQSKLSALYKRIRGVSFAQF